MLTQAELRERLFYSPENGEFWWLGKNLMPEREAGTVGSHGYLTIWLLGQMYLAHRLAWFYVHGVWPKGQIDHANREKLDNRIANLREARMSQQRANQLCRRDNKLGVKGVELHTNRYRARIMVKGRYVDLGRFDTIEEASLAYRNAALHYYGEFARSE